MRHRRPHIEDEESPYPDDVRRNVLEFLGVNKGHIYLAILGVLCGGAEHFHISDGNDRISVVEKTAMEHTNVLAQINSQLGSINSQIAVLQSQNGTLSSQSAALSVSMTDLTKAVYRMQGMNHERETAGKVSMNP